MAGRGLVFDAVRQFGPFGSLADRVDRKGTLKRPRNHPPGATSTPVDQVAGVDTPMVLDAAWVARCLLHQARRTGNANGRPPAPQACFRCRSDTSSPMPPTASRKKPMGNRPKGSCRKPFSSTVTPMERWMARHTAPSAAIPMEMIEPFMVEACSLESGGGV